MVMLHGRERSRLNLARHTGSFAAFAGVRLMELSDGVERGIRMLEFRTGTGLRFTVLVDRALDIAECDYKGAAVGWQSPTGFRHPALHEYEGEGGLGFLRSFSGLLVTCGLDHVLFMEEEDQANYLYPARTKARHSIHGRLSFIPARLTGYGERWDGDRCTLWCEGVVQQSAVFGENLHLHRRIEAEVGTDTITISDRVVNAGFYETPHMMLYHIQAGHPVLDAGSRYVAPVAEVVTAVHAARYRDQGVGYRTQAAPSDRFLEQVWQHRMAPDGQGLVRVALVNDAFDAGRGLGLMVTVKDAELPAWIQWQNLQAGSYALGLEPCSNHIRGKAFARERGELILLRHGEERGYTVGITVLGDKAAIAAAEATIRAVSGQPEDEYPVPTDAFAPLAPGRP